MCVGLACRIPKVPSPQPAPEMRKHGEQAPGAGPLQCRIDRRNQHRLAVLGRPYEPLAPPVFLNPPKIFLD